MDFKLTDEQVKLRQEFYDVCKELEKKKPKGFAGLESIYDTDEGWRYHLYCAREFAKRGWISIGWPPEYGGKGTIMDKVFFAEARGYYDLPGIDIFGPEMLAPTLLGVGNEKLLKRFLPGIGSGEVQWCELWSEPNAGSDLAALSTSAVKKGDHYVINGQKIWSTGAHRAHWAFALVRTDPNAPKKQMGITFILLDMKSPGVTVKPLYYMDQAHVYNEVFLDDVRVPVENVVGEENKGWQVTQLLAGFERSSLGAIMMMLRQLEELVKYSNETKVGGKLLAKDPLIRSRLAQMACEIEALRSLGYRIADAQSRNEMAGFEASGVHILASELQERLAWLGTDILGPYGQVKRSRWAPLDGWYEKWYQQSFVLFIAMGTNEIQRNIIAWYGLGLPRMK
ncbi:MAG: pimeloyl-CoA dehydrogenase large subunit [Chloroflexi bacterium]|nr:pimeloyl-CoA dehydrogenase large subunit [Chloroflexota bacterium]